MGTEIPPANAGDDLLTVQELGEELGLAESTVWVFVKRHNLPRFRVPAKGKVTLIRRSDALRAWNAPQRVGEGGPKKAAA